MPWLALLPALSPAVAAGVPEVALRQITEADGTPLPRPTVGVTAPGITTLPFPLALNFRCPAGTERQQLFVSIADTTQLEDVSKATSPIVVRLDVPIRELPWLMEPDSGCASVSDKRAPDETDDSGIRFFTLHDRSAGYAMLSCTAKDGKASAATTFVPLDIWLSCPAMEAEEPGEP